MRNIRLISVFLLIAPLRAVFPQEAKIYPTDVELVLQKAKKNRKELENFLNYCKEGNDSLKWKAGCFLVRNMDIHYSETFYWADSLNNKVSFNELDYPNYSLSIKAFKDLNAKTKLHPIIRKEYDIDAIKGDFLIKNIERAFTDWKKPVCRNLAFNEFCEYLLPYRSMTEKLEDWQKEYADTFKLSESILLGASIRTITNQLNNKIGGYFVSSFSYEEKNNPVSFLSPSQLLFRKRGHCEDMVNLTALALRSQGLPCRIDMVTYHGTSTGRHFWNVTFDEKHEIVPFEGSKSVEEFIINREPSKVISITYSKQPDALACQLTSIDIPNNFLRMQNYKDVTNQYWRTQDISCSLFKNYSKQVAYAAVLNGLSWSPAWWGKITNEKEVVFPKMGCGVVYLPMIYESGKLIPAAYPIMLLDTKEQQILIPNKINTHTIVMKEKDKYLKYRQGKLYKLFYWDNKWVLLEQKQATDKTELIFDNVPTNALLLMVPEYTQHKERPFIITSSGERIWW